MGAPYFRSRPVRFAHHPPLRRPDRPRAFALASPCGLGDFSLTANSLCSLPPPGRFFARSFSPPDRLALLDKGALALDRVVARQHAPGSGIIAIRAARRIGPGEAVAHHLLRRFDASGAFSTIIAAMLRT